MPRRKLLSLAMILVVSVNLYGCSKWSDPPQIPSDVAYEARDRALDECFDTWINTLAPQEAIDMGMEYEAITHDSETGLYDADLSTNDFDLWISETPIEIPIQDAIEGLLWGPGCPFLSAGGSLPSDDDPENVAAMDCLSTWIQNESTLESRLAGTEEGVLTLDHATGHYRADRQAENFLEWIWEYSIPWGDIRAEVIYGTGCPFT